MLYGEGLHMNTATMACIFSDGSYGVTCVKALAADHDSKDQYGSLPRKPWLHVQLYAHSDRMHELALIHK